MDKPKEFWILPQKGSDCEWTNLYPDASWKSETKPLVHVIEYSAYEQLQSKVSELEDKLYHESRRADEVAYLKDGEIKALQAKLDKACAALERIEEDSCDYNHDDIAGEALSLDELKRLANGMTRAEIGNE